MIEFTTALGSCDEAVAQGRQAAFNAGLGTSADTPAADLAFSVACMAIQGDTPMTGSEADLQLAEFVNANGVCPGDTSLLTRSSANP